MAREELIGQIKVIINDFYYYDLCKYAIETRYDVHKSGRILFFEQNLFHLEAS